VVAPDTALLRQQLLKRSKATPVSYSKPSKCIIIKDPLKQNRMMVILSYFGRVESADVRFDAIQIRKPHGR
jgi:hypothetical protein